MSAKKHDRSEVVHVAALLWSVATEGDRSDSIVSQAITLLDAVDRRQEAEEGDDARLIAAAPELLAALEALLSRLEDLGVPGSADFAEDDENCRRCDAAYAAIAKARGKP